MRVDKPRLLLKHRLGLKAHPVTGGWQTVTDRETLILVYGRSVRVNVAAPYIPDVPMG